MSLVVLRRLPVFRGVVWPEWGHPLIAARGAAALALWWPSRPGAPRRMDRCRAPLRGRLRRR